MKLSEAIRLGAMMHPQAFLTPRLRDKNGNVIATCALGAASEALGGRRINRSVDHQSVSICPASDRCNMQGVHVNGTIIHLNDDHRWTREQIADWVETVENQQTIEEVNDHVRPVEAV